MDGEISHGRQAQEHRRQTYHRCSWTQSSGFARCRYQLRRRRFASCERGGERISAGQSCGHAENVCGTSRWLLLKAAEDNALHHRIEIFDY